MTFFDSNVLFDILQDDPVWSEWSTRALAEAAQPGLIAPVVFAELAGGFQSVAALERELGILGLSVDDSTLDALFAAGQAHAAYRRRGGPRTRVLPDFLIGAQAYERRAVLVTRDPRRYRDAFPQLELVTP